MKFTLSMDVGEETAGVVNELLVELTSRAGLTTDRRIHFAAGESGEVFDSRGAHAGSWRLTGHLSCAAHGPLPMSHEQYKTAKVALWCETCQEFYPADM